MKFYVEKGAITGWRLCFGRTGSMGIDQYGNVRSLGASGEEYVALPNGLFERIKRATAEEVEQRKQRGERVRFHRCADEKRAFLRFVADRLNSGTVQS